MLGTNKLAIRVITGLMAVTTVFFNLYIFLMSLCNYRQRKQWTSSETILTPLSVSSWAHQLLLYDHGRDRQRSAFYYSAIERFYYRAGDHTPPLLRQGPGRLRQTRGRRGLPHSFGQSGHLYADAGGAPPGEPHTIDNGECGIIMPHTVSGQVYETLYLMAADVRPRLLTIKCCVSISVHPAIHLRSMKAKLGAQTRVIRMTLPLVLVFLCFLVVG